MPISSVLNELVRVLGQTGRAVLVAPPGAGKTTCVPLALLKAGLIKGRVLMLEPRRLATRAAAERMADMLGEKVGQTVGYRMRGDSRVGPKTRIEVVTEGILTRMIQSDPELAGIGAVIFDEFHERSLQADLGLALALEIRAALRGDLLLLVMSATLEAEPVARLLGDAHIVRSDGRAFPVAVKWLARPWTRPGRLGPRFETALADLVITAVGETTGGVLVFLPGEGEIRRAEALLRDRLPKDTQLRALYGALPFREQRAAIAPVEQGRKVVLATSIAETSLTIEDICVVVDGGRARRARFDSGSGMSRLVTERVSRAEANQRQGRAGRLQPGVCYKLWTKPEDGGMPAFAPAEIEAADLAPMMLETALWGTRDPTELSFLTPPNNVAIARARALLESLGAIESTGAITAHGRKLAVLPLHPRLGHMVLMGGADAPLMAAILSERDVLGGNDPRAPCDLTLRLAAVLDARAFEKDHPYKVNRQVLARIKDNLRRLKAVGTDHRPPGEMVALAYPDRIGLHRTGDAPRFILSGGKGAVFAANDDLGGSRLIVAADLDGDTREARIRLAVPLDDAGLRAVCGQAIRLEKRCDWSRRSNKVEALIEERLGALILSATPWRRCPPDQIATAMIQGIRQIGFARLPLTSATKQLMARVRWLCTQGASTPDFSEPALEATLEDWLAPFLGTCRAINDIKPADIAGALLQKIDWQHKADLDRLAPAFVTAPTGTRLAIDYGSEIPAISVRLQEMFGLNRHPCIGPQKIPLVIELLSPARRLLQKTTDLPGFWQSTYADVRKDMRGRYPKHPWPENPVAAPPTRRVKPRGS